MKTNLMTTFALGLSIFLAACDGSGGVNGGAKCTNTAACGGDLTGTWKITSTCLSIDPSSLGMTDCPGETLNVTDLKETGTVTFNADKTYSSMTSVSGSFVIGLPKACLTQQGVTVTCSQLNQVIQQNAQPGDPTFACTDAGGGGCNCTVTLPSTPSQETGSYSTTTAGVLTQSPTANGTADQSDYCVKGQTLTVSPHADATAMMGQPGITGTITATKQ